MLINIIAQFTKKSQQIFETKKQKNRARKNSQKLTAKTSKKRLFLTFFAFARQLVRQNPLKN